MGPRQLLERARQRWIAVAIGAVIAVAAGAAAGRGAASEQWLATTRLVLDTPVSQVVESAPKGADSLAWRTEILGALTTTEAVKAEIARDSGVPAGELTVVDPILSLPLLPATLPRRAAIVAAKSGTPYTLSAQTDGELPFVTLTAQTPDKASAAALVEAASGALETAAVPPAGSAQAQQVVVEPASEMDVGQLHAAGSALRRAMPVTIALFTLWCAVALLAGPPGGARRERSGVADALPAAGRAP